MNKHLVIIMMNKLKQLHLCRMIIQSQFQKTYIHRMLTLNCIYLLLKDYTWFTLFLLEIFCINCHSNPKYKIHMFKINTPLKLIQNKYPLISLFLLQTYIMFKQSIYNLYIYACDHKLFLISYTDNNQTGSYISPILEGLSI